MALRAGYKGIKKIGTGLKLTTEGTLSLDGSGPGGPVNLDDLGDVAITDPAEGQILQYDATSQKWVNHINVSEYITIFVNIYSAASDTVTYTDRTGQKTVTTDTDGHGQAIIIFIDGDSITFTSSVAKNPSDLSTNYSKTVNVTPSTTAVYVMPDNAMYWYGYKSSEYQICSEENGWGKESETALSTPTENTNYISCNAPQSSSGSSNKQGIGYKNAIAPLKLHIIWQGITAVSGTYGYFASQAVKNVDENRNTYENMTSNSITHTEKDLSSYGSQYVYVAAASGRANNIYAVWYE